MAADGSPSSLLTESQIGAIIFGVSFLYCVAVITFDSITEGRFVISRNIVRLFVDGLTLSTGITIALTIWDQSIFKIVASNAVYVTVTAGTLILGPILNLAERYGRTIDK